MLIFDLVLTIPSVILLPSLDSSIRYELQTNSIEKQEGSTLEFNYMESQKLIEENINKYQNIIP